jgi:hypothetical protein
MTRENKYSTDTDLCGVDLALDDVQNADETAFALSVARRGHHYILGLKSVNRREGVLAYESICLSVKL